MNHNDSKSDNKERETNILDAAEQLIIRYGYDKTTVSDIAHEAQISKGAIYLHFSSKEALFEALFYRELVAYSNDWLEAIEADERGGSLATVYRVTLKLMHQHPLMMALFKRDSHILGALLRKDKALFTHKKAMQKEFVALMQQVGAIRSDISADVIAYVMNMVAYGLISMEDVMETDAIPPLDEVILGIGEIFERALTPTDGGNLEAGKQIIQQVVTSARKQFER